MPPITLPFLPSHCSCAEFFSIMAIGLGAKGDGVSDDTVAINTFLSKVSVPSYIQIHH
jgi:hypothetical protein